MYLMYSISSGVFYVSESSQQTEGDISRGIVSIMFLEQTGLMFKGIVMNR